MVKMWGLLRRIPPWGSWKLGLRSNHKGGPDLWFSKTGFSLGNDHSNLGLNFAQRGSSKNGYNSIANNTSITKVLGIIPMVASLEMVLWMITIWLKRFNHRKKKVKKIFATLVQLLKEGVLTSNLISCPNLYLMTLLWK